MISIVNAEIFGYGNTEDVPINYSLVPTVNNSDYWGGRYDEGDLDHSLLDNLAWSVAGHTIDTDFLPDSSLAYDLGSGALRWDWLYVRNISAENIDTYSLTATDNITAGGFIFGDGSYLTGVNVTDIWVNESGDTMSGNLNMNENNITDVGYLNMSGDLEIGPDADAFGEAGGWIAAGNGAEAIGGDSFAFGTNCYSGGGNSIAMGYYAETGGNSDISMGHETYTGGQSAIAMGHYTNAFGEHSTAMGYFTNATGNYSTSIGHTIDVVGNYSVGIGLNKTGYIISNNSVFSIMGGKVGIGETNPQQELVVVGNINFTGFIYGDGSKLTNLLSTIYYSDENWINKNSTNGFNFNESMLFTTYYNATQSLAVNGVIDSGNLGDTQHQDGDYDGRTFNFSEQAGSPALDLRLNFTNITSFTSGVMRYKTSSLSGDYPIIQLWDYDDDDWEDYPVVAESESFATITQPVYDSTDHVGVGTNDGVVQMRLYKASNGNTNNHYYVDWIAISKGYGTPAGEEVDPFSWHRNSISESGNFTTTGNVTADYFIGDGSQLTGISGGDNLGNHIATQPITNVSNVTFNPLVDNYFIQEGVDKDIIFMINDLGINRSILKIDSSIPSVMIDPGNARAPVGLGIFDIGGNLTSAAIGTAFNVAPTQSSKDKLIMFYLHPTYSNALTNGFNSELFRFDSVNPAAQSSGVSFITGYYFVPAIKGIVGGVTNHYGFRTEMKPTTLYSGGTTNMYANYLEGGGQSFFGGSMYEYGVYLTGYGGTNLDVSEAIVSDGGDWIMDNDGSTGKLKFGADQDANISWDGTNLVFEYGGGVTGSPYAWFSGNISATGYTTRTTVNNNTNVLEEFNEGNELINEDGSINHTAFGDCYVAVEVIDYDNPVLVDDIREIEKEGQNEQGLQYLRDNYETTENSTTITVTFKIETYPNTKVEDSVDLTCESAKQRQALAILNKNVNLQENITEFDTGIMTEHIYTKSKVPQPNINYMELFKIGNLSVKNKHPAYTIVNTQEVLDMEERIVNLEGAVAQLSVELCAESNNKYNWCDKK